MTAGKAHCRGTRSNGEPCRSTLNLSAEQLCMNHDPLRAEQLREIRAAGGRAAGAKKREAKEKRASGVPDDVPAMPRNLDDATRYFAWIVDAIARNRIDARSGHEMAYALNGFKAAAEKRDMEREIIALRKTIDDLKKKPRRAS